MSEPILLEVVTPNKRVFGAQVSEVSFPSAANGYYGILPGHTPVMTPLGQGLIYYVQGGEKHWITAFGGFAEVGSDHVTILARDSETVDEIDLNRAESARQRALKILKEAQTETDLNSAQAALDRSIIRIQAAGHPGGHGF